VCPGMGIQLEVAVQHGALGERLVDAAPADGLRTVLFVHEQQRSDRLRHAAEEGLVPVIQVLARDTTEPLDRRRFPLGSERCRRPGCPAAAAQSGL
jgi:hypothetical protein